MSQTEERTPSAPDGAESLPGVYEIYAEYDRTKEKAKAPSATQADRDAYDAASVALRQARHEWRVLKKLAHDIAVSEWEASQVEALAGTASTTLKAEEA